MIPLTKPILLLATLPLAFAGCTTTNPKAALDDLNKTVAARLGQTPGGEAVSVLLQTNLTAQSCVAVALLNNRSLRAEFENIGISQADLAQAARLKNIEIGGSWRFPSTPPSAANTEYSVAADFLDLLTLPARKKIAKRELEQTKLRVADSVLRLAADVQAAFYTAQASENLAERLAVIVEVNDASAEVAQRQYDAGNINDLELQNQQASASQARLDLMQAQAQSRADRERLNRLLGLSGQQIHWTMAEELPGLPAMELPLENLESLAVSQRLDLTALRSEMDSIAAALKLKKSTRFIPGVNLGVQTERDTDGQRVTGPNITLELPLFDQGQPAVARLGAQYRQAEHNLAALETNIRSEVRQAQDAMLSARGTVELYNQTLMPQRQKILRQTLLQYNAMQVSTYVLLQAKQSEQIAERSYVESLRDYWIARAELERAVGGRLSGDLTPAPSMKKDEPAPEHQHHNH
jgi:outer membrane protein, heavy metal efflux system